MWYLTGLVLCFILMIFFISMFHNKKLIEKYAWIADTYTMFKNYPEDYCAMAIAIVLWPLTLAIVFIFIFGYFLFKIFSKLIDYFAK